VKKFINILEKIEDIFLIFLFLSLLCLSILQIILRNFFSTSIFYIENITRYLVLWIGLLGASIAIKEEKHISINILPVLISRKWNLILNTIINLFSFIICIFLTYAAIKFIKDEYCISHYTLFAEIILPLVFPLMAIRFLSKSIMSFILFLKNT